MSGLQRVQHVARLANRIRAYVGLVLHQSDARQRCCRYLTIAGIVSAVVAFSLVLIAISTSNLDCGISALGAIAVAAFELALARASRARKMER